MCFNNFFNNAKFWGVVTRNAAYQNHIFKIFLIAFFITDILVCGDAKFSLLKRYFKDVLYSFLNN